MKTNLAKLLTLLIFLTPVMCQAASLTFFEDGIIDGGTYDDVTIMNTATVGMTDGDVGHMYVQNLGTLNYYGGTIGQTELRDSAILNLEGASLTGLKLFNSTTFNLNSGTFDGMFEMGEYGEINVNGGQVVSAQMQSYSFGTTNLYAGVTTWDGVDLHQYSVNNIYGGDVTFNCDPWIDDNSELNIYGGDITFTQGFSLHEDAGINVYYSSIIHLKPEDPHSAIIGYYLQDGSEFMLDQFSYSEINQINFIPEPATLLLLCAGGLLIRTKRLT